MYQLPSFRRTRLSVWFALAALTVTLAACKCPTCKLSANVIPANDTNIRYSGRTDGLGSAQVTVGYSGARERIRFHGTSITAHIKDDSGENYAVAWIDGKMGEKFRLNAKDGLYKLAEGLPDGEHTVEVVRVTECYLGLTHFLGFELNEGGKVLPWTSAKERKIEFIGDSITCGYGIEANDPNLHFTPETENFCLNYSGLTARALNADYLVVSRSGIGMVRNYDGPYEGSTGTMPEIYPHTFYLQDKPMWDYAGFTPDVVCINIGTNDFSTTGVNVEKYISAYVDFASGVLTRYPKAQLVMLQGPMDNRESLKLALGKVLEQLKTVAPGRVNYFELSAQGKVGLGADYHPNIEQSKINAAELSAYLSNLMGWK
jgi:lysophospholipase L1-like esterase